MSEVSTLLGLHEVGLTGEIERPDPSDWSIVQFKATVTLPDSEYLYHPIGSLNAYVIEVGSPDLVMACDAISQDVYEAGEFISNELESYERFQYACRVLYVSSLTVEKKFRGRNFGLSAIKRLIRTFGYGCDTCLILPSPLEDRGDREFGRERLRSFYGRLGFEQFGETAFMGMSLEDKNEALDAGWPLMEDERDEFLGIDVSTND